MGNKNDCNFLKYILEKVANTPEDNVKYEFMQRLSGYVTSFIYLKHSVTIDRLKAYVACDCDYKKTLAYLEEHGRGVSKRKRKDDSAKASVTYADLVDTVCYVNGKLKESLGENIFRLADKNLELAEERLEMLEYGNILLPCVRKRVPKYSNLWSYNLKDCKNEISFLSYFSKATFDGMLIKLDKRKLAYLIHLLDSPSESKFANAVSLFKYVNSEKNSDVDKV